MFVVSIAYTDPVNLNLAEMPLPLSKVSRSRAVCVLLCLFVLLCTGRSQTAADSTPEANPARPTVSTPATLTPVGYLQFENGGLYASGSPEVEGQFSVNQVTKLAVSSRLQLLLLSEPFAVSDTGGSGGTRDVQPGDVLGGVQGVVLKGAGRRPTVSLSYIGRVYSGSSPDLDIGSFQQGAAVLVSDDIRGFHFDLNGLANEQVDGKLRRAQFGQTLSVSHPVGAFTIAGEIWHFSQPLTGGNAVGNLWALSYPVRKNLVVDAGFNRGLTGTSTRWEGFFGFTYLLPHRLWGR